jgi:sugar/nucleoside kinase (ribokinase family)
VSAAAGSGRILVIGDVMTDVIVLPEGPLVRGSDRRAAIRSRPGGSGANQAVWLGAMGADVTFVARVGAADRGQLTGYFEGHGVAPILVGDADQPSGVLVTIVDPDGERSFLTDRGANLNLCRDDLPLTLLDGTLQLVVSGYSLFAEGPRDAVLWLAAEALKRGIAVAVDAASVGFLKEVSAAQFLHWTRGFSTLFANREEAEALSGVAEIDQQMRVLGATYQRVVIKLGAEGAAVGGAEGVMLRQAAPVVEVVDSTGAGDAFAAAFLAVEVRGAGVEECLGRGILAGSEAVQRVGGQPG